MHFVLAFITIVIILWVSVGPVFRYIERMKVLKADDEIRKKDALERRIKGKADAAKEAEKEVDPYSSIIDGNFEQIRAHHDVQYPWSNLRTSFDTTTLKGVMKTLRDNAVKEHKENE